MDTVLTLGADDWSQVRFVRSRLWEAEHAVRTVVWSAGREHHRAWFATFDLAAARARVPLLAALNPRRGATPDFLVPPPSADVADVESELAAVAGADLDVVVAQVRESIASHPTAGRRAYLEGWLADPAGLREEAAAEMRFAWEELLAPWWGPVSRLVDADIAHRSRRMARSGTGRMVDGIDERVVRDGDRLRVAGAGGGAKVLAGEGLSLMPSAFVWPNVVVVLEPPWPTTVVYPARGIAELWARPPAPAGSLVEVLGRTRALLLADLGAPATTTALAGRHELSPAAVSMQLTRLRGAGLVSGERVGKEVRYRRTPVGDALLTAAVAQPDGALRR